jgi:hypothetical protein
MELNTASLRGGIITRASGERPITAAYTLGQQRRHLRRVLLRAFRHRGRDNLTLGIHPNVQFLPACGLLLTVLLSIPCALATDLHATAVND